MGGAGLNKRDRRHAATTTVPAAVASLMFYYYSLDRIQNFSLHSALIYTAIKKKALALL